MAVKQSRNLFENKCQTPVQLINNKAVASVRKSISIEVPRLILLKKKNNFDKL